MLVNIKEITTRAKNEGYAVPHFNINNLEWAKYILEECQKLRSPVILGVSIGAINYMGGYNTVVNIVKGLIKDLNITIPVCIHLDHGPNVSSCIDAINAGFTSVMIDASSYPLEENIKLTKEVVDYAKKYDVTVEAEIGSMGSDGVADKSGYAKVSDVIKLVEETNIDLVAPALGSVHGLYKGEPNLDFDRMQEIKNKINIPLVLHGGTGIHDEQIKKAIECGISKININTELQIEWANQVKEFIKNNSEVYDPRKIIGSGKDKIKEKIREKIILFGSNNKY